MRADLTTWWRLPPVLWLVLGCMFLLTLDYEIGRFFASHRLDRELQSLLNAAEHFGTPYGQVLILLVVASLSGWWEPRIIRLFSAACAAGLAANVVKLMISRTRPHSFPFSEQVTANAIETFQALLPLGEGGSRFQSFPSAHNACAAGFAVALCWAWPAGRGAFWFLAILVGLHRVAVGAHFPSDVCAGMALGWIVGRAFVVPGPLSRQFDRWEQTWTTWNPWPAHKADRCGSTPSAKSDADTLAA